MHRHTHALRRTRVLGVGVAIATAAVVASAGSARSAASTCTDDGYAIALTALTGPQGADLTFAVSAAPGCEAAETLKKVQVKTYDGDGGLADVLNVKEVAADAALSLGQLGRGRRIEADALIETASSPRTYVVRSATTTQLRPDLTVAAVLAPPQTLRRVPSTWSSTSAS